MKTFTMYYTEVKQVLIRFVLPWVLLMLISGVVLYPLQDIEFENFIFYDLVIAVYGVYFLVALIVLLRFREVPCRIDIDRNIVTITLLRRSFLFGRPEQQYTNSQIRSVTMQNERREIFYYIKTDSRTIKVRTQNKWYKLSERDDTFYRAMVAFKSSTVSTEEINIT